MEQLSPRDKDRGTGRTTRMLLLAIEHAKVTTKNPFDQPMVYIMMVNRHGTGQLAALLSQMGKDPQLHRSRNEIIVEGVRVFVRSAQDDRFDAMRGSSAPIYIDHAVHEQGWGLPRTQQEFYAVFLHRIVNP